MAVLGIYWIGVAAFGLPYGANALPTLLGTASNLNLGIWATTEIYMEGAMRGLFSMLFGASALVFLEEVRLQEKGMVVVDRFYRRNLLLILFGLVHAWLLLWPHDVLYAYGLIGMFLFPLRKVSPRVLLLIGFLAMSVAHMQVNVSGTAQNDGIAVSGDRSVDVQRDEVFRDWMKAQLQADIKLYRSDYWTIFRAQAETVQGNQSILLYRTNLFDIGGMMLIGMALFKWGILSGRRGCAFIFYSC